MPERGTSLCPIYSPAGSREPGEVPMDPLRVLLKKVRHNPLQDGRSRVGNQPDSTRYDCNRLGGNVSSDCTCARQKEVRAVAGKELELYPNFCSASWTSSRLNARSVWVRVAPDP